MGAPPLTPAHVPCAAPCPAACFGLIDGADPGLTRRNCSQSYPQSLGPPRRPWKPAPLKDFAPLTVPSPASSIFPSRLISAISIQMCCNLSHCEKTNRPSLNPTFPPQRSAFSVSPDGRSWNLSARVFPYDNSRLQKATFQAPSYSHSPAQVTLAISLLTTPQS